MTKPTPLQATKSQYGTKEKLIESVANVAKEADEDASDVKARLADVSNKKLLRLAEVAQKLDKQYGGSKDKLADAVAAAQGRSKDSDYVEKLRTHSAARLFDLYRAASKRKAN
jgi:regulator of protease activity HflC (stomatin/prohibitin superfamily)